MSSTADETVHLPSERLAHALDVPTQHLESVLIDVGVDPDYLVRALYEGDPQGTFPAVAERLQRERADVVLALVKALVATGRLAPPRVPPLLDAAFKQVQDDGVVRSRAALARHARAPPLAPGDALADASMAGAVPESASSAADAAAEAEVLARFMERDLPRFARRLKIAALVAGVASVGLGALGFIAPGTFRVAVWLLAAGGFVALGGGLLVGAWRLHAAGKRLAAFADAVRAR